jgi:hypothetical protein
MASDGRDDLSAAGSHGYDAEGDGEEARTWDLMAPPSHWRQGRTSGLFPSSAEPGVGSSSFTKSRPGLDSMDLNAGAGWEDMHQYTGFLHGDNVVPPCLPLRCACRPRTCRVAASSTRPWSAKWVKEQRPSAKTSAPRSHVHVDAQRARVDAAGPEVVGDGGRPLPLWTTTSNKEVIPLPGASRY